MAVATEPATGHQPEPHAASSYTCPGNPKGPAPDLELRQARAPRVRNPQRTSHRVAVDRGVARIVAAGLDLAARESRARTGTRVTPSLGRTRLSLASPILTDRCLREVRLGCCRLILRAMPASPHLPDILSCSHRPMCTSLPFPGCLSALRPKKKRACWIEQL
jgi:hypothetical protein